MTMNFRLIDDALTTVLGAAAAGRFRVVGYQAEAKGSDAVIDDNRLVEVFFASGEFPKSGGTLRGPVRHNMTFNIFLTVAKSAECDLSVIDNPASTPVQISNAIAAAKNAAYLADKSLNELADHVYQILMDARNIDLQLPFVVANRWIESIQKDAPLERGSLVVLTGLIPFTCTLDEQVEGDLGVAAVPPVFDTEIQPNEDDYGKAGVLTGG